jgi:hypothetical protein
MSDVLSVTLHTSDVKCDLKKFETGTGTEVRTVLSTSRDEFGTTMLA